MYNTKEQVGSWRKVFNEKYNANLKISDVHDILEKYRIPHYYINRGGKEIKCYQTVGVLNLMHDGTIKREIEKIKNGVAFVNKREKLSVGIPTPAPSNEPQKRNGRYVIINNNQPESIEDDAEYRNGENNMEEYSKHLINNIYQFENKTCNKKIPKRIIKEYELKQIVESCVRNILNEIGDTPNGQRALGAVDGRATHRFRTTKNPKYDIISNDVRKEAKKNLGDVNWKTPDKGRTSFINHINKRNAYTDGYVNGFYKSRSQLPLPEGRGLCKNV